MVTRKRLRSILTTLGLYVTAALLIGYFGVNAYSGNHGLKAKEDLDHQIGELTTELGHLKVERGQWERRVALLRSDKLDPDMRPDLDALQKNVDMTKDLGFVKASFDVKAHSDLSLIEEAAKRLK